MVSQLKFPYFTPVSLVEYVIGGTVCSCGNPVFSWLTFGKLPENPTVTPSASTQFITPSSINRYLQSVTVNPIPVTPTPGA